MLASEAPWPSEITGHWVQRGQQVTLLGKAAASVLLRPLLREGVGCEPSDSVWTARRAEGSPRHVCARCLRTVGAVPMARGTGSSCPATSLSSRLHLTEERATEGSARRGWLLLPPSVRSPRVTGTSGWDT